MAVVDSKHTRGDPFSYRVGFLGVGGHVESRTTSSGSTITCLDGGCSLGEAISLMMASAARKPMVRSGWRTVVNAGFWKAAD